MLPIDWLLIAFSLLQLHLLLFLSTLLKLIQSFNKIQMILISQKYQISFKDYQRVKYNFELQYLREHQRIMNSVSFSLDEKKMSYSVWLNYHSETYRTGIPFEDQIILTLVRLRHDMTFEVLAYLRGIGKTTAIEYFWRWIDIIYATLKQLIQMADRDHIFDTIPTVFKSNFPRLTSIIDCFEIFIESSRYLLARAQCLSQYKRHCTIKVFISYTPLAAINLLSKKEDLYRISRLWEIQNSLL